MDLFVYLIATVPNVCWVGLGQVLARSDVLTPYNATKIPLFVEE